MEARGKGLGGGRADGSAWGLTADSRVVVANVGGGQEDTEITDRQCWRRKLGCGSRWRGASCEGVSDCWTNCEAACWTALCDGH